MAHLKRYRRSVGTTGMISARLQHKIEIMYGTVAAPCLEYLQDSTLRRYVGGNLDLTLWNGSHFLIGRCFHFAMFSSLATAYRKSNRDHRNVQQIDHHAIFSL